MACQSRPVPGFEGECAWGARLGAHYPGDVGVVGALMLNLVSLSPGDALYLSAGHLHAYLEGTGVELMANSDNVLRGGLTPKHVDVPELLRVLEFSALEPRVLRAHGAPEAAWETPAPEFRLSRFEGPARVERSACDLWLCTEGAFTLRTAHGSVALGRGESCFVGADEGAVEVTGQGQLFRATVGDDAAPSARGPRRPTALDTNGPSGQVGP